jgi:Invasion associated locus B (IalB) protein
MTSKRILFPLLTLLPILALTLAPAVAVAQDAKSKPAAKTAAKPAKPAKGKAAKKQDAKKTAAVPPAVGGAQPTLLGQYGDWGAYTAAPGGKKLCFVIARPANATTTPAGRNRDQAYMFISTRPAEKVKDEISVIMGYPTKPNADASAEIGSTSFAMYTEQDGAWLKNPAEESKMVMALRAGSEVVVKGESGKGTKSSDTYSLKGLSQALDRTGQECK